MNLLSNAVKYTAEGGKIVLDIEEKPSVQDDFMTLQIRVSDNGIGISKEYIPHIFDAFTRERSSSESGIIGTGLGLHIVKSFVDLMNGDISVESESGKGTCFTVEISCRKVPEEELQQQMEEQPENVSLAGVELFDFQDPRPAAATLAGIPAECRLSSYSHSFWTMARRSLSLNMIWM